MLHVKVSYFLVDAIGVFQNKYKGEQAGQSRVQRACVQHTCRSLTQDNKLMLLRL